MRDALYVAGRVVRLALLAVAYGLAAVVVLAAFSWAMSTTAHAAGTVSGSSTATTGWCWPGGSACNSGTNAFPDAASAGADWKSVMGLAYVCHFVDSETSHRWYKDNSGFHDGSDCGAPSTTVSMSYGGSILTCPGSSTKSGSTCTCNDGLAPNAGATACVNACVSGSTVSSGYFDIGTDPSKRPVILACSGGCESVFDGVSPAGSALQGGARHYFASGSYIGTGNTCSTGAVGFDGSGSTAQLPPEQCPSGQQRGTVNGVSVCAASGAASSAQSQSPSASSVTSVGAPASAPNGGTSVTTTRRVVNPDGSVAVETTVRTSMPDGSSTDVKTCVGACTGVSAAPGIGGVTNPDGAASAPAAAASSPPSDECSLHPSSTGCGGVGVSVSGSDLYTAKTQTFSAVLTRTKDQFFAIPALVDVSGFFTVSNAGTCPQSTWHIPFLNADVVFDFFCTSMATQALGWMRVMVQLVALLLAFRIAIL